MIATKPSKCRHCKQRMEVVGHKIHPECVDAWYASQKDKLKAKKEREDKRCDRAKRESMKTIPQLIKEADQAFAAFIRERDRLNGHACISSNRPLDWSGNQVDAGHYRSRGAASHLRYDEDNCHAQSKRDNLWKAGNVVEYRINLIKRIGVARVERLETSNEVIKWERDVLRQIITIYRAKLRKLRKESGNEELARPKVTEASDGWPEMDDDTNG